VKRGRSTRRAPSHSPPPAVANELLAALPAEILQRLSPALEPIPLVLKTILHQPGDPIEFVYFPGGGFVSELAVLENGDMVEIATIGREGMVGVFASRDAEPAPSMSMVQVATDVCYRLTAGQFRQEMDRRGPFMSS
jgi:CRP-like cAMP-binding protein